MVSHVHAHFWEFEIFRRLDQKSAWGEACGRLQFKVCEHIPTEDEGSNGLQTSA